MNGVIKFARMMTYLPIEPIDLKLNNTTDDITERIKSERAHHSLITAHFYNLNLSTLLYFSCFLGYTYLYFVGYIIRLILKYASCSCYILKATNSYCREMMV